MLKLKHISLTILSLLCIVSCERRPLDILATSLRIIHVPDYSLEYQKPTVIPEHYRVNMYDSETGKLIYKDFIPDGGGHIISKPGKFLCFLCNFDEGHLVLTGEKDISTFHITGPDAGADADSTFQTMQKKFKAALESAQETKGGTTKADGNDIPYIDQRVMALDDYFWAGQSEADIPFLAASDESYTITVNTTSVPKQGYVQLNGIVGVEYISSIQCFVTNLAGGINPVTRELDSENVTEKFYIRYVDGIACGTFLYFGINGGNEPHFLYALVTDTAGGRYLYVYNLGPIEDGKGLFFNIDSGIIVPEPETSGGGGFNPTVNDWNVVYNEISLGSGK